MSDKPTRIIIPKDRFQVGSTPDGAPIWVDPKDLVPTEDERLQTKENLLNKKERHAIDKLASAVLVNAGRFVQATFYAIAPKDVLRAHEANEMGLVAEWVTANDYQVIQDGLTTVVKVGGKIIRKMTARVSENCADLVDKRVRQMMASKN